MTPDALLSRIALTLREDVGPTVDGEYPKTQAFMAAVVLEKLSLQLAAASSHEASDRADVQALRVEMEELVSGVAGCASLRSAVQRLGTSSSAADLSALIEAVHASRDELGERFEATLARVRRVLRAQIDRRFEVAK
jgi:hypothetical protein